jgi:hypothetical protein
VKAFAELPDMARAIAALSPAGLAETSSLWPPWCATGGLGCFPCCMPSKIKEGEVP